MGHTSTECFLIAMVRSALVFVTLMVLGGFACSGTDHMGPRGGMTPIWHVSLRSSAYSYWEGMPALDGAKLFVEDANDVVALDAGSGATLWSSTVKDFASPSGQQLLTGGGLVFVSEATYVTALDENTGAIRWQFAPDSQPAAVFPSVDDRAYYTGQRGIPFVYALDRGTGAIIWKVNVGSGWQYPAFIDAALVSGDTVFGVVERYLDLNGFMRHIVVVALNRLDGSELWRFESSQEPDGASSGAVLAGDLIIINNTVGHGVIAVSKTTHGEAWRLTVPGEAGGTALPAVDGETVYVGLGGGFVYALDRATGRTLWTHTTRTLVWGIAKCGASVVSNLYDLERYDPSTGAVTGHFKSSAEGGVFTSNLLSDGTRVFVTGQAGVSAVTC
jgi:outer membrane protein assembly factor BamB